MSPTILPEIVRCNLRPMRHALDTYETQEMKPEQAAELFFLCSFLADAIEKNWARVQSGSRNGIEGRKLSSLLQEVCVQIEESLQTYERLQRMVRGIPDYRAAEGNLSRLTADIDRVEQVRRQAAALLEWLNAPAPPIDPERLKSLETGPFVRLTDLQGRRGSQGS
jgi:hypothetical protein